MSSNLTTLFPLFGRLAQKVASFFLNEQQNLESCALAKVVAPAWKKFSLLSFFFANGDMESILSSSRCELRPWLVSGRRHVGSSAAGSAASFGRCSDLVMHPMAKTSLWVLRFYHILHCPLLFRRYVAVPLGAQGRRFIHVQPWPSARGAAKVVQPAAYCRSCPHMFHGRAEVRRQI